MGQTAITVAVNLGLLAVLCFMFGPDLWAKFQNRAASPGVPPPVPLPSGQVFDDDVLEQHGFNAVQVIRAVYEHHKIPPDEIEKLITPLLPPLVSHKNLPATAGVKA